QTSANRDDNGSLDTETGLGLEYIRPEHAIELQRINTYRLQQHETVGSTQSRTQRDQWLPLGAGKPYPPELPHVEAYIVEFEGSDDPMHPQNWPMKRRMFMGGILTFCALVAAYASAIFATAAAGARKEFGFGQEVASLGTTLFVLGFATGPTIWAPTSELVGRRWPLLIGMFGFNIFTLACATGKDTQTIMLSRFFSGLFAASVIALVPASLSDLFNNNHRGIAISIYTLAVFTGPFTAPFIGGFIAESYLGWRWTLYITTIAGFFGLALMLILTQETYAPIILVEKAVILRRQTRNWGIHARQEELEIDFYELVTKNFARPFRILFTEPIAFLITVYMSFIYGLCYAMLQAYPLVFQGVHRMSAEVSGLPFIGLLLGAFFGGAFVLFFQRSYARKLAANEGVPVPEWRLPPCIVGGVAFAGGLFWFGWTGFSPRVHWMAPAASGVMIGFGLTTIFMQGFNYLLDSYLNLYVNGPDAIPSLATDIDSAASAFAANTIMRSLVGACFPLFTRQMFANLGIQWAGTLLGCIGVLMVPIPLLFMNYGPRLRRHSRLAPQVEKHA
ncbi:putative polyamine transporter, partial [Aspergillus rambellii]